MTWTEAKAKRDEVISHFEMLAVSGDNTAVTALRLARNKPWRFYITHTAVEAESILNRQAENEMMENTDRKFSKIF